MTQENSDFTHAIPEDFSIPDFTQPQQRSKRTSQPKPEKPVRKQIHEYFLRAFSKDAPLGKLFREHTETIDAHSTTLLEHDEWFEGAADKIKTLETTVTELEATNSVLTSRVKALEEMVLELIDASNAKEE